MIVRQLGERKPHQVMKEVCLHAPFLFFFFFFFCRYSADRDISQFAAK